MAGPRRSGAHASLPELKVGIKRPLYKALLKFSPSNNIDTPSGTG